MKFFETLFVFETLFEDVGIVGGTAVAIAVVFVVFGCGLFVMALKKKHDEDLEGFYSVGKGSAVFLLLLWC